MSSKKVLAPYRLLTSQAMASDFQSSVTNVQFMDRVSYSVVWTGSAVGTLIVQSSLDGTNWTDLDMNQIVMANADDTAVIDIAATGIPQLRLSYTATSGTGSLDAYVSAKES